MFPLSFAIPGVGNFRKLIGRDTMYNSRPVYQNRVMGEIIFFKGTYYILCKVYSSAKPNYFDRQSLAILRRL